MSRHIRLSKCCVVCWFYARPHVLSLQFVIDDYWRCVTNCTCAVCSVMLWHLIALSLMNLMNERDCDEQNGWTGNQSHSTVCVCMCMWAGEIECGSPACLEPTSATWWLTFATTSSHVSLLEATFKIYSVISVHKWGCPSQMWEHRSVFEFS